jgi:outer membrane protein OmpA-like peptidoglycan-associated protein
MSLPRRYGYPGAVGLALALAACTTFTALNEQLAASKAAIESAQIAGAAKSAPQELAQAREKLTAAQLAATTTSEIGRARRLADEALADAQLAQAKASTARSRDAQTPTSNPALAEARAAVNAAGADPAVSERAATELQRARDALAVAEQAWQAGDEEETRTRAYIAKQRAGIASAVGARVTAQQSPEQTGVDREGIRTDARASDTPPAETRAAGATQPAANAQMQASDSQTRATNAEPQPADSQAKAEAENQRAEAQTRQLEHERDSAANMQKDLESLAAKSTARGIVVTLPDVLFDVGKARLRGGGLRSLERVAGVLRNYPERRVLVEAFTDSQGSEDYNVELSRRRADAVKDQLEAFGLPDRRVETRAYGEAFPVADNNTVEGRQQNRRVELVFSDANGQFSPR